LVRGATRQLAFGFVIELLDFDFSSKIKKNGATLFRLKITEMKGKMAPAHSSSGCPLVPVL